MVSQNPQSEAAAIEPREVGPNGGNESQESKVPRKSNENVIEEQRHASSNSDSNPDPDLDGEPLGDSATEKPYETALKILGFPVPWRSAAGQRYTDRQIYPFYVPTKKKPKLTTQRDIALTSDGTKMEDLLVQATSEFQDARNSTWGRIRVRDISTTVFHMSKLPNEARKTAAKKFNNDAAGWVWFCFIWILTLAALIVWTVSQTSVLMPFSKSARHATHACVDLENML